MSRHVFNGLLLRTGLVLATATACTLGLGTPSRAGANPLLPMVIQDQLPTELDGFPQDSFTFYGEVGTPIILTLVSEDFDGMLVLLGPDGEVLHLNDDPFPTVYEPDTLEVVTGSANFFDAGLYLHLPATGTYTVQARSFSGIGGDYELTVRPATAYEAVLHQARQLYSGAKPPEAIELVLTTVLELYDTAIAIEPTQPHAYAERALVRLVRANEVSRLQGDLDYLPFEDAQLRALLLADAERAVMLFEQNEQTYSGWYTYSLSLINRLQTY
ncbi:MAG: hypothetical protein ACFB0C_14760 [Leptolyngbyaceae cyanobacterium]